MFLADHTVVGGVFRDQRPHRRLGQPVRFGHRPFVGLGDDVQRSEEILQQNFAGGVGQLFAEGDQFRRAGLGHGVTPAPGRSVRAAAPGCR